MKALSYFKKGWEAVSILQILCFLMAGIMAVLMVPSFALGQWTITTVDSTDEYGPGEYLSLGQYSSLAVDASGKAHVSYMGIYGVDPSDQLKYATNATGSWAKTVVDSASNVGEYSSIAIGQANHVHISYRCDSLVIGNLKYATNASGTWATHVLDTNTTVGYYTSIAVNPTNDHVYVTNVDQGSSLSSIELVDFLSSCAGSPACYTNTNIESIGASQYTSIALDSIANPHISYYEINYFDSSIKRLRHASYVMGEGWVPETVDGSASTDVGQYSSIAIDSTGNIHISYYDATNSALKHAWFFPVGESPTWITETIDNSGDVGKFSSIAVDSAGHFHISYYDDTNDRLKYVSCSPGIPTSTCVIETVEDDTTDSIGQYSSIAVDTAGYAHISYHVNNEGGYQALRYATKAITSPCTFSISPDGLSFGKTGGAGSISVTTQVGCAWTATSTDSWISIDTGASGSGNGTVTYTVTPNAGDSRTGTISVAGYTHTVEQSAESCVYAINIEEFYIPSSGGTGYKFAVTAKDGCAWTVNNSDPSWVVITSDDSGIGNGTVMFSVEPNMGSGERSGSLSIEGEVLAVTQRDNTLTASLAQMGSWVQLTFDNDTGDDIVTIRPSCYRSYFFMTDSLGKIVPHRDFITAVAIPDDVVTIPTEGFTLNCDLTRMFAPQIFSLFTPPFTLMATFANYLSDTAGDDSCTYNPPCYNLWTGAIPSGTIELNMTDIPSAEPLPAGVSFFPSLWNADWATSSSETITAIISGLSGTPDPNKIILNGTVGIIPGSYSANSPITVKFNAAQAVQSLGSIGMPIEGDSVRAYPRVSVQTIEGDFFTAQNGVEVYTSEALVENALTIDAVKHTVATGTHPTAKKEPIQNMAIRIYDKSPGSCAANLGISWKHYPSIWGSGTDIGCLYVAQEMTDANGRAAFDLPAGDFLAIGKFVDGAETLYPGVPVGAVMEGAPVYKQLQIIVNAKNEKVPGKYRRFDGSELLVIEPEYVEWDGTEELYPFVFDSVGDWDVNTAISPPEGFVSDQSVLGTEVNSELRAVQFTITDFGSDWIPTDVKFTIKHKKKTITMKDKVGIKLSKKLAEQKGISIYGEEDAQDEEPQGKRKGKGK